VKISGWYIICFTQKVLTGRGYRKTLIFVPAGFTIKNQEASAETLLKVRTGQDKRKSDPISILTRLIF
jgi:hypothetical protein